MLVRLLCPVSETGSAPWIAITVSSSELRLTEGHLRVSLSSQSLLTPLNGSDSPRSEDKLIHLSCPTKTIWYLCCRWTNLATSLQINGQTSARKAWVSHGPDYVHFPSRATGSIKCRGNGQLNRSKPSRMLGCSQRSTKSCRALPK